MESKLTFITTTHKKNTKVFKHQQYNLQTFTIRGNKSITTKRHSWGLIGLRNYYYSILTGLEETGNPVFELKIGIVPGPIRWFRRTCLYPPGFEIFGDE